MILVKLLIDSDQEGTEGGKDEGHWVDGFLFKSYTHAEDMPAMEPVLTFEEGEFGIEWLIPVISELGAFYSASELKDPLLLGATFMGSWLLLMQIEPSYIYVV